MDERVPDVTSPISAEIPVVVSDTTRRDQLAATVEVEASASFEAFYFASRDSVAHAVALAIGDLDLAADSTDEAMIRAYQRWAHVGTLDRPAGWVFRVAINYSRSRLRRVARKARYVTAITRDRHTDDPFSDRIGDSKLLAALQSLTPDRRAVVVLRVLLQFSEEECATALGIRRGTAKSRLHRGLAQLRDAVPHLTPDIDALVADDQA
jgi:RNA polymerase sigma-70 factor (ECF subfamily)